MSTQTIDAFTRAYLHAAAFTQDPHPGSGEYPEPAIEDFDPDFVAQAIKDCRSFQDHAAEIIFTSEAQAGHDFWLTRNGHGAGFWDGDWAEKDGEELTALSETFGECYDKVFADGRDWEIEED